MAEMQLEDNYLVSLYARRGISLVRGRGSRLWDSQGREYIDCMSGQGVMNLGHAHPKVLAALRVQSEALMSCPMSFYSPIRARFAEKLVDLSPASLHRAFFCNSGTEAVEAALKFSRLATGRSGVLSFMRGFHGRTMGALSATFNPKYRKPFEPLVPGFEFLPYNKLDKLEATLSRGEIGAVVLELVQGEGGVHPASLEFVQDLFQLCRKYESLIIVDEVQTGFGRTGKMFACEHFDLEPDILCLAKGIASGLPMGATLVSEAIAERAQYHGSTFGGNPLACAVGLASLEVIETENLLTNASKLGESMLARLRGLPYACIREVRGVGLMIGIELNSRVQPVLATLMAEGVLALPAGPSVLRILPPLGITEGETDQVIHALSMALSKLHDG